MKLLSTLRGRLFALLAVLGTVTALAVGGATYVSVRAEADALFDYQLRQTALSLRDQGRVAGDEEEAPPTPTVVLPRVPHHHPEGGRPACERCR